MRKIKKTYFKIKNLNIVSINKTKFSKTFFLIFCAIIILFSGLSAGIELKSIKKEEQNINNIQLDEEKQTNEESTIERSFIHPDISLDKDSSFIGNTGYEPWYYYIGDLINSANGNLYIALKDISIKGRGFNLEIIRSYNSYNQNYSSSFGYGWTFNYHTYIIDYLDYVIWVDGDGSFHNFTHIGGGLYNPPKGIYERLTKNPDKTFTLRFKNGMVYNFNTIGQIVDISDKNDNKLNFIYDGAKLLQVKDDSGIFLNFSYNDDNLISMIEDPMGRAISYEYDFFKNLKKVNDVKGNCTKFLYQCCHRLGCFIDRVNTSILFSYDDLGLRVHDIRNAVYDESMQTFQNPFVVFLLAFDDVNYSTYYVTSNNYAWLVKYNSYGNPLEIINPMNGTKSYTWQDNLVTSYTDENENTDKYTYDSYGNLKQHFNAFMYETIYDWKIIDTDDFYLSVIENISKISYDKGTPVTILNDNLEPPSSNWNPSPMWIPFIGVYYSPVTSWSCGEATVFYGDGWNEMLDYKYLNLSGYTDVKLTFWHKGDFDGDPTVGYMPDGGNVKISTDGGLNWTIVYPDGGYDGKLAYGNGNPLEVEHAFGYNFNWRQETIDLSAYVGMSENISIRFNMGTDMFSSANKGWYIDDIVISGYNANEREITTSFYYDENGNLEEIEDALVNSSFYSYDSYGNLISETDFRGNTTVYSYDIHGNMRNITDPTQNISRYSYDVVGRLINFTDANGFSILYFYDNNDNVVNITDATGNFTRYIYNADDAKISEIDALGRWTNFTDNVVGEVENKVDPSGETTYYKYDHDGRLYESTDVNGNTRSSERDPMGRITSVTDPLGNTEWYGYDAKGNIIYYMDKNYAIYHYQYDKLNRITRIIDPYNSEYKYVYDEFGNVIEINDENGNSVYYRYDDLNRVIEMDGPGCCGSGVKIFSYDENGNRVKFTDANGYTTTYVYDELNRHVGVIDANGNVLEFRYDGVGNTIGIVDKNGNEKTYKYDGLNRIYQVIDALGNITTIDYDAVGNVKKITNARDDYSTFTYDSLNRMISFTDALGNTTNYSYYFDTLLESVTDPNKNTITYGYDSLNRLEKIIDPLSGTTQYFYDAMDNIIKVVDANLNETLYTYDALNRLISVGNPIIGNYEYYTYDNKQNIKTATNAKGGTTFYKFDGTDRVISIQSPNGYMKSYKYDPVGNLVNKTDFNGDTTLYTYDNINQLVNISYPLGFVKLDYDSNGNIINISNNGVGLNDTTTIDYDALDRQTSITVNYGSFIKTINYTYDELGFRKTMTNPDGEITSYEYDKINRLVKITNPSDNNTLFTYDNASRRIRTDFPNGIYTTYEYDPVDRLTKITTRNSTNNILKSNTYVYDNVGNRISMTDENSQQTSYTYDAIYRLTDVIYPSGPHVQYTYDTAGNRLLETINGSPSTSYSYDFENRLTSDTTYTYSYDNNGNLIQKTDGANTHQYKYDYNNRMIQYIAPDNSTTNYYYTPYDFRISKSTPTSTIYYLNDGGSNLLELDSSGVTQARYTHGLGVDDPISINRSGNVGYYHQDVLGSVLFITGGNENIISSYDFDVFGNILNATESIVNNYKFTGREFDSESGLYYLRERYYDPVIGRMLGKDWAFLSNSLNLYVYVDNNPVTFVDPLGMEPNQRYNVEGKPELNNQVNPNNPPFSVGISENGKTTEAWFIVIDGELKQIPGPFGGDSWLKVTDTETGRTHVMPDPDKLKDATGAQKALFFKEQILDKILGEGDQILRGVITQWFEQNKHNPKIIQFVMRIYRGIIGRECFQDVAADAIILFIEAYGEDLQGYLQGLLEEGVETTLRDYIGSDSGFNKVMDALKEAKEWNDSPGLKLLKTLRDSLPSCGSATTTPDGSTPTKPSGKRPRHTGPITPSPGSSETPSAPEPDPEDPPKPKGGKSKSTQTSGGSGSSQEGVATNPYDPLEPPGPGEQGPGIPTYLWPPWFPPWDPYNITQNGGGGGMPPGEGGYILIDEPPEYCAYRIVYFSHDAIDNTNENLQALYNAIKWAANHIHSKTTKVLIMPSKGGYDDWGDWQTFASAHSDLIISRWSNHTDKRITITYSGLKSRNCDVLIDSDHALSTQQGGFYSSDEIEAISKYLEDEHGYIATFGTLGDESGQTTQTTELLSLLGLEKRDGDPHKYSNSNTYVLNDPLHPIFTNINTGWNPGDVTGNVDIGVCPRCGERHEGAKLAYLQSGTGGHHAVISAYQLCYAPLSVDGLLGSTGECISVPQTIYFGNRVVDDVGNNHDVLYNAIKWAGEHDSSIETKVCIMPGWGGYDGWSSWQAFDAKYPDINISRWSDQQYSRNTVTTAALSTVDADVLIESNHSSNTLQGGFYTTGELQALEWYISTRGHGLIVSHGSLGEHSNQVEQKEKLLELLKLNDTGAIDIYDNSNTWSFDEIYHPIIYGLSTWDPGRVTGEVDVDTAVKIAHLYSTSGNHHSLISASEGYGKGVCACNCNVFDVDYISITNQPNGTQINDQVVDIGFNITGYASGYNNSVGYISQIPVSWCVQNIKSNASTAPLMGYSSTFETGGRYSSVVWVADDGYGHLDNVSFIIDGPPEILNVTDNPDPQEQDGFINISCIVFDDFCLDNVSVIIAYPNSSTVNMTMSSIVDTDLFYYNDTYSDLGVYSYFIWANDTSGKQNISSSYTFEIVTQPNNPPYTPNSPDPYNGETDVDIDADLSWTGGDPDPGDIVSYDVYFGTISPPPQVVSGQSGTTYDPGTMSYDTTYYWQIVSWDNHGASTSGSQWQFTTENPPNDPPNPPSNPDPYNGEIDVDINIILSWDCSDPNGDSLVYDVYFEANDPTPDILVSDDQIDTTYDPGELEYETTYYWQIIAKDIHDATTNGPIWHFTTEEEPPKIPDLDCSGTLTWTEVKPGDTVTANIIVENNGDSDSLLDWEIDSYPDWSTWTFNPDSGTDLLAGDSVTIVVEVVAPNVEKETFTGDVILVNSEDPDDICTLDVILATPTSLQVINNPILQWIFERYPNSFPILRQVLGY